MQYDNLLFIDFDGTITTEETLTEAMRQNMSRKDFARAKEELFDGQHTLAEVLHWSLESLPSACLDKMLAYVEQVPLRPGFQTLLDTTEELGIPVVIISGGLRPYIRKKLEPFKDQILAIYDVATDARGEKLRIHSDYEEGGELMAKVRVMETFSFQRGLCIGDGMTDIKMARACQVVFARDDLVTYMKKEGRSYEPWETFYDVAARLRELCEQ